MVGSAEGRKLHAGGRSRRRSRQQARRKHAEGGPPVASAADSFGGEDRDGQRHERMTRGTGFTTRKRPGRGESRRGERSKARLNPDPLKRIVSRSKASKPRRVDVAAEVSRVTGEDTVSGRATTARGQRPATSRRGCEAGEVPGRRNPGRGCGMKQDRKVGGGGSRREVVKT